MEEEITVDICCPYLENLVDELGARKLFDPPEIQESPKRGCQAADVPLPNLPSPTSHTTPDPPTRRVANLAQRIPPVAQNTIESPSAQIPLQREDIKNQGLQQCSNAVGNSSRNCHFPSDNGGFKTPIGFVYQKFKSPMKPPKKNEGKPIEPPSNPGASIMDLPLGGIPASLHDEGNPFPSAYDFALGEIPSFLDDDEKEKERRKLIDRDVKDLSEATLKFNAIKKKQQGQKFAKRNLANNEVVVPPPDVQMDADNSNAASVPSSAVVPVPLSPQVASPRPSNSANRLPENRQVVGKALDSSGPKKLDPVQQFGKKNTKTKLKNGEQNHQPDTENDNVEEEVIRCICGSMINIIDMVECEQCCVWHHFACWNIPPRRRTIDVFLCEICDPAKKPPFAPKEALEKLYETLETKRKKKGRMSEVSRQNTPNNSRAKSPPRKSMQFFEQICRSETNWSIKATHVIKSWGEAMRMKRNWGGRTNEFAGAVVSMGTERKKLLGSQDAHGIFATVDINKNTAVMEIAGFIYLPGETLVNDIFHPFVFVYDGFFNSPHYRLCIDATELEHDGRYVRRKCSPNAVIRHVEVGGDIKFFICTLKNVTKGSEIFLPFDYGFKPSSRGSCPCSIPENCRLKPGNFRGPGHLQPLLEVSERKRPSVQALRKKLPCISTEFVGGIPRISSADVDEWITTYMVKQAIKVEKSNNQKTRERIEGPTAKKARFDESDDVSREMRKNLATPREQRDMNSPRSSLRGFHTPSTGASSQNTASTFSSTSSVTSSMANTTPSQRSPETPVSRGLGTSKNPRYRPASDSN